MTFDLQRIIESKRAWRRELAQRPIAEKLAMLDALRDRARTIRAAASRFDVSSPARLAVSTPIRPETVEVRESPMESRRKNQKD